MAAIATDHAAFLRDVAAIDPPPLLSALIRVLQAQGEQPVSPPIAGAWYRWPSHSRRNPATGTVTALLRWPTAPRVDAMLTPLCSVHVSMQMPIIRVGKEAAASWLHDRSHHSLPIHPPHVCRHVFPTSSRPSPTHLHHPPQADEYIQRALVEETWGGGRAARGGLGEGGGSGGGGGAQAVFAWGLCSGQAKSLDAYLTTKRCWQVGKFPDVLERLAVRHLELLHCKPHPPSPPPRLHWCWQVGMFPDVLERLALRHLEQGDQVSALVAGEFYARKHFPGFAHPFTSTHSCCSGEGPHHTAASFKLPGDQREELWGKDSVAGVGTLSGVGRPTEARDAARIALKSPWWTLGASYQEVAELAGYGDSQLEYALER
ncbi:unnamed protein product [Closterium sp. NIES-64]|nr:unnamed protein product [Closterium sp. NIES-64]